MKEGDVILTPIPQADGNVKNRPAILLREIPIRNRVVTVRRNQEGTIRLSAPTEENVLWRRRNSGSVILQALNGLFI